MTLLQFLSSLMIYMQGMSTALMLDPVVVTLIGQSEQQSLEWAEEAPLWVRCTNGQLEYCLDCKAHTLEHSWSPSRMVELMVNFALCSLVDTQLLISATRASHWNIMILRTVHYTEFTVKQNIMSWILVVNTITQYTSTHPLVDS